MIAMQQVAPNVILQMSTTLFPESPSAVAQQIWVLQRKPVSQVCQVKIGG